MRREYLDAKFARCQGKPEELWSPVFHRRELLLYPKRTMSYAATVPGKQRSNVSIVFTSTVRVLFTTLLFSAAGMGVGLFLGIVGTVVYGIIRGSNVDMSNAYKHVAIPVAVTLG